MDIGKKRLAFLTVAIGLWMIGVPLAFEFVDARLVSCDLFSGAALVVLGALSLSHRWPAVFIGAIGIWLQLAPLVFWAPQAAHYLNDTIMGAILICFAFSLRSSPAYENESGVANPKGWSYNPSSWKPRIITTGLAFLCWTFSRYMAAYQLGYIDEMWDPVFKDGSLRVITSKLSHDFPVSDAGLGAVVYTLEFLFGWQGSSRRWYTTPWLVLSFGILVVPVGFVSIVLIILQPVVVGAWCFWCLLTAACMLGMILLSGSELVAALSFLKEAVGQGACFWQVLWRGKLPESEKALTAPRRRSPTKEAWGFTLPWNLVLLVLSGAYLMFSPFIFAMKGDLATVEYVLGPLMVALTVISMVEVYRSVRFVNVFFGIFLVVISFLLGPSLTAAHWNAAGVGLAATILAFPRGLVRERYGSWDRFIV